MAHKDIKDMLDQLRRIKSRGDLNVVKINEIETLEMELRYFRTFIKCHHVVSPDSLVKITKKAKLIVEMLHSGILGEDRTLDNVERLVSELQEFNFVLNGSYLLRYMDCLDQNLNDAPRYLVRSDTFFTERINILQKTDRYLRQIKIIQNKMRFIRYLYGAEICGYVDHEKMEGLETRIKFMADNVGQFCLAIWVNEDGDDTFDIESKPSYLLFLVILVELEMKKIFLCELNTSKYAKSRTFTDKKLPKGFSHHLHSLLMYLRKKKLKNFVSARNIDVAIEFLLVFLGDVPNLVISGKRLNEVLEKIRVLVGDILCVVQILLAGSTIKEETNKIDLGTIHILEKIEDLKLQVKTFYKSLKLTPSHEFPTVGGFSFLDSLLKKLNEMLKSETGLDFMMKPHIRILEKELSSLTYVFQDAAKVQHEHEILEELRKHIINLVYEAEVAIDSTLSQYNSLWHCFGSLPAIIKELNHINVEVTEMRSVNLALRPCSLVEPYKHLPAQHSYPVTDDEIVGFGNDTEKMIECLIGGTYELDVLPIVGMGGQGKTTIARKLYNNKSIVFRFDVQAWCVISQTYNRRELLQKIFNQVTGSKDKEDEVGELADKLRKRLMGKRYLIVLDDMWDSMAWDELSLCFPDVGNRSRIVVTTRLEKVGEYVKRYTELYFLPFLTPDESCKLLQKIVFQKEDFPPELQDVSLAVAKRCKGLPLVVVLAAGIIKKGKMEECWWNEVKDALFEYLDRESEEYSQATMRLSFDNLPDCLKPCLLYMGMFLEDAKIPASKLISLWIAEGFVENTESGRLMEEEAEGYLMDLISSNVVMVSRRSYNGKVKYCQVHDVVHHFCLEKSRKEKFMLAVTNQYLQFQPLDRKGSRVRFSFSEKLSKCASRGSKTQKPFHQHLRSLITTNQGESYHLHPLHQVSEVRLLKVLDFSSILMDRLSSATFKPLNHLKYLAVWANKYHFHPESHLPHLETLIVKYNDITVSLPASFWEMKKLRHVDINSAVFDLESQNCSCDSFKLENLRILRGVIIDEADKVDALSQRCPNLQQLSIEFWIDNDSADFFRLTLENLTQLQKLRLSFMSPSIVYGLQLPSNLKKLVLNGIELKGIISFIAELPSLEYLQLNGVHLIENEFSQSDITFHKLKLLKLVDLDISRWDASEESFPMLETLVIIGYNTPKEIPLSFADIPTLKQIKLIAYNKNKSLETSAVRIKEAVEDNEGCDRIDLIIKWGPNAIMR